MKLSVSTGFTNAEDLKLKVRSHENLYNAFPVQKVTFDKIFVGIKFIYRLFNLALSLQTLTFDDESCNGTSP